MSMPHGGIDGNGHDRGAVLQAAGAIIATLLAGLFGYVSEEAGEQADDATAGAQVLALDALGTHVDDLEGANQLFERHRAATVLHRRAGAALARATFGTGDREAARLEHERLDAVARASERRTADLAEEVGFPAIELQAPFGPLQDPTFPFRHFQQPEVEATQLTVMRDAQNALAAEHRQQASGYGLALAMVAVAVFFFGFGLTPQGQRHRGLFAVTALGFVLAGSAYGASLLLTPPEAPPREAAETYAEARFIGNTSNGTAGYGRALELLNRSIALWPENGRAYTDRAHIRFHLATPRGGHFGVLVEAPEGSIEDLEAARARGYFQPLDALDLGTHLLLNGIRDRDPRTLERALDEISGAQELWEARPEGEQICFVCVLTPRATAQLALGRTDTARSAVTELVDHIHFIDPEQGIVRDDRIFRTGLAASGFEMFTLVGERYPELEDVVTQLKQQLMKVASSPEDEYPESEALITDVEVRIGGDRLGLAVRGHEGFDPERDAVDVGWYRLEENGGWTFLPSVSGRAPLVATPSGGFEIPPLPWLASPGPADALVECLRHTRYRAEVYVNGRLVTTAEAEGGTENGIALRGSVAAGGVGATVCGPQSWSAAEPTVPHLVSTFAARDRSSGAFVSRVGVELTGRAPTAEDGLAVADEAVAAFAADLDLALDEATAEESMFPFPEYRERTIRRASGSDGRAALVFSGIAGDAFVVAVLWGPGESLRGGELLDAFHSLANADRPEP